MPLGETLRVLQVVGAMNRNGTETWLMHVLRSIDRNAVKMDFLVHTTTPCHFDAEIRSLGCTIIPCLDPSRPLSYAKRLRRALREHGPYDIVHSHVHYFSGYVLRLAHAAAVPGRFAHSHSDTRTPDASAGLIRRTYLQTMRRWILTYATTGLACSRQAGASLYGRTWGIDPRWQTLYCGIDLESFRHAVDCTSARKELKIPPEAAVYGHVARFEENKNHEFVIAIAQEIARRQQHAYFLLVGDGPRRPYIARLVREVGLSNRVLMPGVRDDVPRLMLGVMNAFLFPSKYEGLGLVLLEAQAAGLPCIMSDTIPTDVEVAPHLLTRIPLSAPPKFWADAAIARTSSNRSNPRPLVSQLRGGLFDVRTSAQSLVAYYRAVPR